MKRWLPIAAVVMAGVALGIATWVLKKRSFVNKDAPILIGVVTTPSKPTLYCDFYNFMHNSTVVSFYFSFDLTDPVVPKVSELFVVEPDGTKTDFASDGDAALPQWSYRMTDEAPTITSPDSATNIVLYGLKPTKSGTFWVEAGLRSNDYRNLDGKCRQANFDQTATSKPKS